MPLVEKFLDGEFSNNSSLSFATFTDFGMHASGECNDRQPDDLLFAQNKIKFDDEGPPFRLELSLRCSIHRGGWLGEHIGLPGCGTRQKTAQCHQLLPIVSRRGRFTR